MGPVVALSEYALHMGIALGSVGITMAIVGLIVRVIAVIITEWNGAR